MPTKRPIIDAIKRCIADMIDYGREFVKTNTFVNCLLFSGAVAFFSNLDAQWLTEHPTIKTWLPPTLACITAISYKVGQMRAERAK
jgi:hypothetical protein